MTGFFSTLKRYPRAFESAIRMDKDGTRSTRLPETVVMSSDRRRVLVETTANADALGSVGGLGNLCFSS